MGNAGSSGASSTPELTTARKTCYYELLSVERSSTQEEIKKAYKRKALELHPDRNYSDVERTTKLFTEVQAAYEVLSDPQERAWYDSHRDSILHGRDPDTSAGDDEHGYTTSTTSQEILSWFTLLPSKSKIDYSDSTAGFYTVLSKTFAKLADEERSAAVEQGLEEPFLPSFGGSKSGYDDHVKEFYKHWTCFKTIKNFAWYDVYRPSDAPDRRIRRAMEKENDRLRHDAKREFEDNVREFVQFVRKRDPRYIPHIPKTEAERQSENVARSKEQAARARAANTAAQKEYRPADWTQVVMEDDDEYSEEGEEEKEERLVFECVACRKTFKTEGQMGAHEKSKKHRQVVWQLKKQMEKENRELGLSTGVSEEEGEENGDEQLHGSKDTKGSEVKEECNVAVAAEDEIPSKKSSEKQAPKKAEDENEEDKDEDEEEDEDEDEEDEEEGDEPKEAKDSDYVSTSTFHARVFGSTTTSTTSTIPGESNDETVNLTTTLTESSLEDKKPQPQPPKIGKAKAKREKKKAAAAAASGSATPVSEHMCAACKEQFASKTKMFGHLKENPSHVAALPQGKGNPSGGGGGGGKSKGKKK